MSDRRWLSDGVRCGRWS